MSILMSITNYASRNKPEWRYSGSSNSQINYSQIGSYLSAFSTYRWTTTALYLLCFLCLLILGNLQAAENPEDGDIRNLKVGIDVNELPSEGYVSIRCAMNDGDAAEPKPLSNWTEHAQCPKDSRGHSLVSFDYDDSLQQWAPVNDKWEGTKIAGHPVLLTIAVDKDDNVVELRAKTDPAARAYMKKKAYLLSLRVKARYGRDGWTCTANKPSGAEVPVGGVFINEHCEKALPNRRIQLQTRLYRPTDQALEDTVNSTEFKIVVDQS